MFKIVVLTVFAGVTLAYGGDFEKCERIFRPDARMCCKQFAVKDYKIDDDLKECFDNNPPKQMSCEQDICIADKKGYLKDKNSFDKKAYFNYIEKSFDETSLIHEIKEVCIDGDLESFGPPEMCDLAKLRHCVRLLGLVRCPEWNAATECSGLKELAEECFEKH